MDYGILEKKQGKENAESCFLEGRSQKRTIFDLFSAGQRLKDSSMPDPAQKGAAPWLTCAQRWPGQHWEVLFLLAAPCLRAVMGEQGVLPFPSFIHVLAGRGEGEPFVPLT